MLFDKITKKAVTSAANTIKEKTNEKVDHILPVIVSTSAMVMAMLTFISPSNKREEKKETVLVNNFYIGGVNK